MTVKMWSAIEYYLQKPAYSFLNIPLVMLYDCEPWITTISEESQTAGHPKDNGEMHGGSK